MSLKRKNSYDEDKLMADLTEQFQTRFHKDLDIFKSRTSVSQLKQGISAILAEFLNVEEHFQVRLKLTPVIKSLDGLIESHKRWIISEKANFFSMDYQKRNRDDMQQIDDVLKKVKFCINKLTIEDNRQFLLESISDLLHRQNDDTISKAPAVKKTRRRSSSSNSTETVVSETNDIEVNNNKQSMVNNDDTLLMMDIADLDFLPGIADDLFADFDAYVINKESVRQGVKDDNYKDLVHDSSFDALFYDILSK